MIRLLVVLLLGFFCTDAAIHRFGMKMVQNKVQNELGKASFKELDERSMSLKIARGNSKTRSMTHFRNWVMVMEIYLGTPAQAFYVVPNTGSFNVWVVDKSCKKWASTDECTNPQKFDSSVSTTYTSIGMTWNGSYPADTIAFGFTGRDTLRIGEDPSNQLEMPDALFGQATKIKSPDRVTQHPYCGSLGLAYSKWATNTVSILMQDGVLERKVFTTWFTSQMPPTAFGGYITFGGVDTEKCGTAMYTNLTEDYHWKFEIHRIGITNKVTFDKTYRVISNSGSIVIAGPFDEIRSMAEALGGIRHSGDKYYRVSCDQNGKENIAITVEGQTYEIMPRNYLIRDGPFCYLAMVGNDWCENTNQFIFGLPFSRQFCIVHDYEHRRIGFATSANE